MLEIFNTGCLMAFKEKSAWIMSIALLLGGLFYGLHVADLSSALPGFAPPNVPSLVIYTLILIVIAIVGHVAIAILAPKEANAPTDEREQRIFDRAAHWSSYVLGFGVIVSLLYYLVSYDGNGLFYGVFASLMLSQLCEYLLQIWFYRSAL